MTRTASLLSGAALMALATAFAPAVHAATILETASFTGDDPGDYTVIGDGTNANSRFMGASFSLTGLTDITSIGLGLGRYSSGSIFAAIIPLAAPGAYPSVAPADLASIALGEIVFSVPAVTTDLTEAFSLRLGAGDYAIVFGSGLFGAHGYGAITSGNDTIGTPLLFQSLYGPDWLSQYPDGIRMVVTGTPVPEPASTGLLAVGLAGLLAMRRRRRIG